MKFLLPGKAMPTDFGSSYIRTTLNYLLVIEAGLRRPKKEVDQRL
jgi:hypothetical protein